MFKVAVVGCGLISTQKYLPILLKLSNRVSVVGICDLREDVLRETAAKFRISNAHKDFSEMLSKQLPDLVVICTPPATHKHLSVQAMAGGAHVLVEKPMALTPDECDEMIEASIRYNRKLGVMHNQLFNPAIERAKDIMATDEFGKFLGIRIFLATSVDYMTSNPNHWAHKLPGGVLGETGPHAVYLSLAFLDEIQDVEIRCKKLLSEYPWSIAEDIRFDLIAKNGISSVALTYGSTQTIAEIDLIGTKGLLKLDLQSRTLVKHRRTELKPTTIATSVLSTVYQMSKALVATGVRYAVSKSSLDPHYIGINRFLDYLEGRGSYPATGEDGKRVIAVMEMLVQKMRGLVH